MNTAIAMDPSDNVATVLQQVFAGEDIIVKDKNMNTLIMVKAKEGIPFAHKICVAPISKNDYVHKFGVTIGLAVDNIAVGEYVHIHNLVSIEGYVKVIKED